MIQAFMFVSLGFLAATMLALLIAPAAWARAVRLTTHRIRNSLPINETEIRAEKDQLRASHAVTVHQLEKKIDRAELSAARQRVELNRREAKIVDLEEETQTLSALLDENRNARHVLAQTLNERLPRAEERLQETRRLLRARDSQIVKFVAAATEQHTALSNANGLIAQQEEDIKRLNMALMAREYSARQRAPSEALEQTAALQSELRELRQRTSDQARLIDRIQGNGGTPSPRIRADELADDLHETIADEIMAVAADSEAEKANGVVAGVMAQLNKFRVALKREQETTSRLRKELIAERDRAAQLSAHKRSELRSLSQSEAHQISAELSERREKIEAAAGAPDKHKPGDARSAQDENPLARLRNGKAASDRTKAPRAASILSSLTGRPDEKDDKQQDADAPSSKEQKSGERLTERLRKTSAAPEKKSGNRLAEALVRETPAKSGTLLQRLKGMEKA